MIRIDVIRLAGDAGLTAQQVQALMGPLERLVDLAQAAEREALLKLAGTATGVLEGVQWLTVAEHGMPDLDEEVIGGLWYTDPWLKPERATRFMWGLCRVVKDGHRDFKDGKRWQTFGPSHNDITHWARLNMPALAAAQAKGGQA